jgi:uncharacterized damage-inducible protein DinB
MLGFEKISRPKELMNNPEVWLRGPLEHISPTLMPVAHALLQAREDVEIASDLTHEQLWMKPSGAASVGFHLCHIVGSIDRLLTYAEGEQLSKAQLEFLRNEENPVGGAKQLIDEAKEAINKAVEILRNTKDETLFELRGVGRKNLPSTVIGLLYHIGEHTSRHAGQMITTSKIIKGTKQDGTQWFEADSSMISGYGYDEAQEILELDFLNSGHYLYFGVPKEVFEQLHSSSSKGSYVRDLIVDQYRTEKGRSRSKRLQ